MGIVLQFVTLDDKHRKEILAEIQDIPNIRLPYDVYSSLTNEGFEFVQLKLRLIEAKRRKATQHITDQLKEMERPFREEAQELLEAVRNLTRKIKKRTRMAKNIGKFSEYLIEELYMIQEQFDGVPHLNDYIKTRIEKIRTLEKAYNEGLKTKREEKKREEEARRLKWAKDRIRYEEQKKIKAAKRLAQQVEGQHQKN